MTDLDLSHSPLLANSEILTKIPAESVWLANFSSENTQAHHRQCVQEFIALFDLQTRASQSGGKRLTA